VELPETVTEPASSVSGSAFGSGSPPAGRYHRVLLKLSGEVFGGGRVGLDPDVVASIAS
jgi:uridylate kinase